MRHSSMRRMSKCFEAVGASARVYLRFLIYDDVPLALKNVDEGRHTPSTVAEGGTEGKLRAIEEARSSGDIEHLSGLTVASTIARSVCKRIKLRRKFLAGIFLVGGCGLAMLL